MAIRFDIVGKLSLPKETDKFKNYEELEVGKKGWVNRTLKFNVQSNSNSFMMRVRGGSFKDGSGKVFLRTRPMTDESGKRIEPESFTIEFKDRLKFDRISEVDDSRKFVVDLDFAEHRRELARLLERYEEGTMPSVEELKKVGVESSDKLKQAYEDSLKKRKEFVTEWDFAVFLKKMLDSEKYKDSKFVVSGEYTTDYNETNGNMYKNYVPKKVYLADDKTEEKAEANVRFYFNKDSLDEMSLLDTGKYFVNGYTFEYNSGRKANIPVPYQVVVLAAKDESDKEKKREKVQRNRFVLEEDDDKWYEYGMIVELLSGAQREELKFEDLTEEQQDSILLGELTLRDIQREIGNVYGERIVENRFLKPAYGFSKGRQETVYTDENFEIKSLEQDLFEDKADALKDDTLFDDDEDLFS